MSILQQNRNEAAVDEKIRASVAAKEARPHWASMRCPHCGATPLTGYRGLPSLDAAMAQSTRFGLVWGFLGEDLTVLCGEDHLRDFLRDAERSAVHQTVSVDQGHGVPGSSGKQATITETRAPAFVRIQIKVEATKPPDFMSVVDAEAAVRPTRTPSIRCSRCGAVPGVSQKLIEGVWTPSIEAIVADLLRPEKGWHRGPGSSLHCCLDCSTRAASESAAGARSKPPLVAVTKLDDLSYQRELDRSHAARGLPPDTTPAAPPQPPEPPRPAKRSR